MTRNALHRRGQRILQGCMGHDAFEKAAYSHQRLNGELNTCCHVEAGWAGSKIRTKTSDCIPHTAPYHHVVAPRITPLATCSKGLMLLFDSRHFTSEEKKKEVREIKGCTSISTECIPRYRDKSLPDILNMYTRLSRKSRSPS